MKQKGAIRHWRCAALVALAAMVTFGSLAITAQAQLPGAAPAPGPEHKRLGAYVGEWSMEGQAKDSPFGPAGTFSGKEKVEWFAGGFFLVSHVQVNGSMGEVKSLSMLGYDPEKKVYSYHSFNSMGMHETATGTVSGDAWTWTNESVMNGKRIQGRYIIKEDSPTAQSFIFEISEAGGPWKTIMEGKSTKTK